MTTKLVEKVQKIQKLKFNGIFFIDEGPIDKKQIQFGEENPKLDV